MDFSLIVLGRPLRWDAIGPHDPVVHGPALRLQFGSVTLVPDERVVLKDGRPLVLTPKAFDLLAYMATNPGRLLTKDELMRAIWPDAVVEESNLAYTVFARMARGETLRLRGAPFVEAAVATGENLDNVHEFTPLIANDAADIYNVGQGAAGITGAMQVADLAYAFDRQTMGIDATWRPRVWNSTIGLGFERDDIDQSIRISYALGMLDPIFWVAASYLATGIFLAPIISGREPRGQAGLTIALLVAVAVVVFGSMIGEYASVKGALDNSWFWLGHQGWEYLDLGRLWQILLVIGLTFWLVILARGQPALSSAFWTLRRLPAS